MIRPSLLLCGAAAQAVAADLRVIRVSDGDTFTGLNAENKQVKIPLHRIDAPETGQAFGNVSKDCHRSLISFSVWLSEPAIRPETPIVGRTGEAAGCAAFGAQRAGASV
jgi:endonuclease YncB( thermonuclease family)